MMVFVHGGGFVAGSADDWSYGAGFLVNDGVVVVSFNYRLGSFGFLSTGDSAAQGNWGMKDQVQALKWVQQNIHKFGGNPDDVTIFGESAGSVSVNYLVISPMAKGVSQIVVSFFLSQVSISAFQKSNFGVWIVLGAMG